MSPGAKAAILAGYRLNLAQLGNNAAWYSLEGAPSDSTYLLGTGVSLIADRSGNSGVNGLVLNGGVAGVTNGASVSGLSAFGTGNFTIIADMMVTLLDAAKSTIGSEGSGCQLTVNTNGTLQSAKAGVANNTASTGAVALYSRRTIGYTRSGTTGTYYIDGVAAGTTTDSQDYTGKTQYLAGSVGNGATNNFTGVIFGFRTYSVALDASGMLADFNGAVQSNNVVNSTFTTQAKLAASFVCASGQTVTINTSGDLGARICGARDRVQLTAAKQRAFSVVNNFNVATADGSNDYDASASWGLAQPCTRFTVWKNIAWNSGNIIWSGRAAAAGKVTQTGSTPNLQLNAGSAGPQLATFVLGQWAVMVEEINGASSSMQRNLDAANTADAGATNPGGDTVGADSAGANNANMAEAERIIFNGLLSAPLKTQIVNYFLRKYNGLVTVP